MDNNPPLTKAEKKKTKCNHQNGVNLGAYSADVQLCAWCGYHEFPPVAQEELQAFLQGLFSEQLCQLVEHAQPCWSVLNLVAELVLSTWPTNY